MSINDKGTDFKKKAYFDDVVGIKTSPDDLYSLDVSGDVRYLNGNVGIGTEPLVPYRLNVGGDVNIEGIGNKYYINNTAVVSSQWATSGTTIEYNTGSVGIGTSALSYKLNVNGSINATSILVNGAILDYNALNNKPITLVPTTTNLQLASGYNFLIGGNVGIGTTIHSTYKVDVNGTLNATNLLIGGNALIGSKWTNNTADATKIYYNGGNVGIGTTNPQAKLDVVGNDAKIRLLDPRSDGNASIEFKEFDNNNGYDINYAGTSTNLLQIRGYTASTTGVPIISCNRNRCVGIGHATDPTSVLEIRKDVYNGAILSLDVGNANDNIANMPREIGKPMIKLGRSAYSQAAGDYYGIGFGYSPLITDKSCCEIGTIIETTSGNEFGSLVFSCRTVTTNVAATERMRIYWDGDTRINKRLGIGFDTYPQYTLDIPLAGTGSSGTLGLRYFNYETNITASTTSLINVSARIAGAIWCGSWIASSSDSRIKEDIQDINDDTALNMILAIEPKTYKYIDKVAKGDKKVYGFIAQQIREVLPDAIGIEPNYIPNIMLLADYDNNIITLPSQPTKVIIKLNDKIRCYDKDNQLLDVEVIEIIDELTFKIKKYEGNKSTDTIINEGNKSTDTIINDFKYTDNKIFVSGTEVDDFHTISKEYIFTLNVCATQELHRRIISQEERIRELEEKVERLLSLL
jgi:hypothetical protein